jgi:hypothetical protein
MTHYGQVMTDFMIIIMTVFLLLFFYYLFIKIFKKYKKVIWFVVVVVDVVAKLKIKLSFSGKDINVHHQLIVTYL